MSSSPPTDPTAAAPRARWPATAGWSLRARLVAAMVILLGITCVIVGITTEITLRNALYDRIDHQLTAAASRSPQSFGGDRGGADGGYNPDLAPGRHCVPNN